MTISKKAMDDFKAAYRAAYGEEITDDEAQLMGTEILSLIRLLLKTRAAKPPETAGSST